jgi:long-subunit acyl-CoA synthetase (AMP-forming)
MRRERLARRLTYADALAQALRIAKGLLARRLTAARPIAIIADNSPASS